MVRKIAPMMRPLQVTIRWIVGHRALSFVVLVAIYCFMVVVGSQFSGMLGLVGVVHLKLRLASKEKMALPLPDKPSIAVMPFLNMTGEQSQDFFCDGLSESLITALSSCHNYL